MSGGLGEVFREHALVRPAAEAVRDEAESLTWAELWSLSGRLLALLERQGALPGDASSSPRPLAIAMRRGCMWYALCLAAWRRGVPVVALTVGEMKSDTERARADLIVSQLCPAALVSDTPIPGMPPDCVTIDSATLQDVRSHGSESHSGGASPQSILCYVYTGGTTKHSRCVAVTHAMALWEVANYPTALDGQVSSADRMLQYSSAHWGAAVFGQLDVALAFGACVAIVEAADPDAIAAACVRHEVTVLGIVPSQLRGAWPGGPETRPSGLRVLISWAERLPPRLGQEWKAHVRLFELLIASEYWLSFVSDCSLWRDADGVAKHVLRPLPGLDFRLLREDGAPAKEGEVGELYLAGPTVSPGYVVRGLEAREGYYRTGDRLRRVPRGLVYCGRADSLVKRGGAWLDLEASEQAAQALPGCSAIALVPSESGLDAFAAWRGGGPFGAQLERLARVLGNCRLHLWGALPVHPATAKVDRRLLAESVAATGAREALWARRLSEVQRRMLLGYAAWHLFAAAVVVAPSLCLGATLGSALGRLLLLPYLWASLLFLIRRWGERSISHWRFGLTDALLLCASALPALLLLPAFLASFAFLLVARDRNVLAAAALLGAQVIVGLGAEAPGLVALAATAFGILRLLAPGRLEFLLGLPVCYLFAFPKWARDDWTWKSYCGPIRSTLLRLLRLGKPCFAASSDFREERAYVEWADDTSWPNVRFRRTGTASVFVGLWEDVQGPAPTSPGEAPAPAEGPPATLARLLERLGCRALASLDSLQAIRLVELVRQEMGLALSVSDVLRSSDVEDLAQRLRAASSPAELREVPDEDGAYRVYTMRFCQSPVDWVFRYGGPGHLDLGALQRAVDRLVARHSALRTTESPDEPLREAMDRAAAVWQLACSAVGSRSRAWRAVSRVVSSALFACWPRTLLRSAEAARLELRLVEALVVPTPDPEWPDWPTDPDDHVYHPIAAFRRAHRWPLDVMVVPVYTGTREVQPVPTQAVAEQLPPEDVAWYVYTGITHAYSDGASGQALLGDLLRLYAEESGLQASQEQPAPPEHLAVLQRRLRRSLRGRTQEDEPEPNEELYHEIACEDWGRRPGMQMRVYLAENLFQALGVAREVLGCGSDVVWLTAILGAMYRLFPEQSSVHLILKCACRDGPGEAEMVGFLSEQRVFAVDVGDTARATLLDVAWKIDAARRARAWRAPVPYEAGLSVYANIVSSMSDRLPLGCRHVVKATAEPQITWSEAYHSLNLRLDQRTSLEWDFRIFHWDAHWGWGWGECFANALASVIGDLCEHPTAPINPPPRPRTMALGGANGVEAGLGQAGGKRKGNFEGDVPSASGLPKPKSPRLDS